MKAALLDLDVATYQPHLIHRDEERIWPETNCYVDLWVELLHGMGLEPVAAMAFTVALDYEGDQFTFFKFPLEDIEELFGLQTMELQIWKSLPEAIYTQLKQGRSVIVEMDSFHLPDTRGVSYGIEHVKSSVAVADIDLAGKSLGYFHNRSFHRLAGQDYAGVFHEDGPPDPARLPPYFEVVKPGRGALHQGDELRRVAAGQLARHLKRRPAKSPVRAFAADYQQRDQAWLLGAPLAGFHAYAFATVRQLGANAECAASFLRWLAPNGASEARAAEAFTRVASGAKAFQFKLARMANNKKPFDPAPMLAGLAEDWDAAMGELDARHGG